MSPPHTLFIPGSSPPTTTNLQPNNDDARGPSPPLSPPFDLIGPFALPSTRASSHSALPFPNPTSSSSPSSESHQRISLLWGRIPLFSRNRPTSMPPTSSAPPSTPTPPAAVSGVSADDRMTLADASTSASARVAEKVGTKADYTISEENNKKVDESLRRMKREQEMVRKRESVRSRSPDNDVEGVPPPPDFLTNRSFVKTDGRWFKARSPSPTSSSSTPSQAQAPAPLSPRPQPPSSKAKSPPPTSPRAPAPTSRSPPSNLKSPPSNKSTGALADPRSPSRTSPPTSPPRDSVAVSPTLSTVSSTTERLLRKTRGVGLSSSFPDANDDMDDFADPSLVVVDRRTTTTPPGPPMSMLILSDKGEPLRPPPRSSPTSNPPRKATPHPSATRSPPAQSSSEDVPDATEARSSARAPSPSIIRDGEEFFDAEHDAPDTQPAPRTTHRVSTTELEARERREQAEQELAIQKLHDAEAGDGSTPLPPERFRVSTPVPESSRPAPAASDSDNGRLQWPTLDKPFEVSERGEFWPGLSKGWNRIKDLSEEDREWASKSRKVAEMNPRKARQEVDIGLPGDWGKSILSPVLTETEPSNSSRDPSFVSSKASRSTAPHPPPLTQSPTSMTSIEKVLATPSHFAVSSPPPSSLADPKVPPSSSTNPASSTPPKPITSPRDKFDSRYSPHSALSDVIHSPGARNQLDGLSSPSPSSPKFSKPNPSSPKSDSSSSQSKRNSTSSPFTKSSSSPLTKAALEQHDAATSLSQPKSTRQSESARTVIQSPRPNQDSVQSSALPDEPRPRAAKRPANRGYSLDEPSGRIAQRVYEALEAQKKKYADMDSPPKTAKEVAKTPPRDEPRRQSATKVDAAPTTAPPPKSLVESGVTTSTTRDPVAPHDPPSPRSPSSPQPTLNDLAAIMATAGVVLPGAPRDDSPPRSTTSIQSLPEPDGRERRTSLISRRTRSTSWRPPVVTEEEKEARRERRKTGRSIDWGKDPQETTLALRNRHWKIEQAFRGEKRRLKNKLAACPNDVGAMNALAELHFAQSLDSTREGAKYWWTQSIQQNREQPNVWLSLAKWQLSVSLVEDAIVSLEEATKYAPENGLAWLFLALAATGIRVPRRHLAWTALTNAREHVKYMGDSFSVVLYYELGKYYEYLAEPIQVELANGSYHLAVQAWAKGEKDDGMLENEADLPLPSWEELERRMLQTEAAIARAKERDEAQKIAEAEKAAALAAATSAASPALLDAPSTLPVPAVTSPKASSETSSRSNRTIRALEETTPTAQAASPPRSSPPLKAASPPPTAPTPIIDNQPESTGLAELIRSPPLSSSARSPPPPARVNGSKREFDVRARVPSMESRSAQTPWIEKAKVLQDASVQTSPRAPFADFPSTTMTNEPPPQDPPSSRPGPKSPLASYLPIIDQAIASVRDNVRRNNPTEAQTSAARQSEDEFKELVDQFTSYNSDARFIAQVGDAIRRLGEGLTSVSTQPAMLEAVKSIDALKKLRSHIAEGGDGSG